LVLAKIILQNESIEHLIFQDNELGEDSADKIGCALIQNKCLKKLVFADNKIKNKGAKSILENADQLTLLNLSR
jgi:Ran GTPase-activating protein (RanGAP) involved in mRNA processing and transport